MESGYTVLVENTSKYENYIDFQSIIIGILVRFTVIG